MNDLVDDVLICAADSGRISDSASLRYGTLALYDAFPLVSCEYGGRKVVILTEFSFSQQVSPFFQLHHNDERVSVEEESKLNQPNPQEVVTMRNFIVFLTPRQEFAEYFISKGYEVKLGRIRK